MNYVEVAGFLSDLTNQSWVVTKDKFNREFIERKGDGLSFWFSEGGYGNEGKIAIHFSRPEGRDGRAPTLWLKDAGGKIPNPSIKVSATKSSEQIAKDMVRRILPESENVFKLAWESIDRDNKFLDGKTEAIKKIAKILGGVPEVHYQSGEMTGEIDPYKATGIDSFKGQGYGKFKVNSEDSVTLELTSMNLATATKVAEAIRNIFKNNN